MNTAMQRIGLVEQFKIMALEPQYHFYVLPCWKAEG